MQYVPHSVFFFGRTTHMSRNWLRLLHLVCSCNLSAMLDAMSEMDLAPQWIHYGIMKSGYVRLVTHSQGFGEKPWGFLWFPVHFQMAVCQSLVPLVNPKIAGKWMFIPLKMVLIGIDPYPDPSIDMAFRGNSCPSLQRHLPVDGWMAFAGPCQSKWLNGCDSFEQSWTSLYNLNQPLLLL